jgi:succinoglycan biosynthesis protein ExoA
MDFVSIIVPCYNEQSTIRLLLESIGSQTYPHAQMEVILADGMSTDQTRSEIGAFSLSQPDLKIKVVENPDRIIPAGLNCAIRAAQGEWIIRLDGHSMPYPDYVERIIEDLKSGVGDNVGGVWEIRPGINSWMARCIAAAAAHPFGVGDALYRYSTQAKAVDTVPFGAFNRNLFNRVGFFDETLQTNEDYEFNARIRRQGGKVWLDPQVRSVYFSRSSVLSLARQYWRYGFWKLKMLLRFPDTLRWRQALPPLFVLGLLFLLLVSPWWVPASSILGLVLVLYAVVLLAGALPVALRQKDALLWIGIPLAIAVMHFSWGTGFLWSVIFKKA